MPAGPVLKLSSFRAGNSVGKIPAQLDFGLDFGFFNNRVTGEIDYYQKKTTDLLLYRTLPATSGFEGVWSNVGRAGEQGD